MNQTEAVLSTVPQTAVVGTVPEIGMTVIIRKNTAPAAYEAMQYLHEDDEALASFAGSAVAASWQEAALRSALGVLAEKIDEWTPGAPLIVQCEGELRFCQILRLPGANW